MKRYELREFLIIPLIIITLMIGIYFLKDKFNGALGNIFFPMNNNIIEQIKYFFTPIVIVIILEYLLMYEMPNNYLFSRVISLITMIILCITFNFIYLVFSSNIHVMIYFPFYIIILYLSQTVSYILQKSVPIKFSFAMSFSIFVIIIFLVSFMTFSYQAIS